MKYQYGDNVRVISLDKIIERPSEVGRFGSRKFGVETWESPEMDKFAGTTQVIAMAADDRYEFEGDDNEWVFSEEMIEGLDEPEYTQATKNQLYEAAELNKHAKPWTAKDHEIAEWLHKMYNDSSHIAVYLRTCNQEKLERELLHLGYVKNQS